MSEISERHKNLLKTIEKELTDSYYEGMSDNAEFGEEKQRSLEAIFLLKQSLETLGHSHISATIDILNGKINIKDALNHDDINKLEKYMAKNGLPYK